MVSRESLSPGVNRLSVLPNAGEGCATYYAGSDVNHVSHLRDCVLIVGPDFKDELPSHWKVLVIRTPAAQEAFYRLSAEFKEDYLESEKLELRGGAWVHPEAELGERVLIGHGAVIGPCEIKDDVVIGPQAVIYAKSKIEKGTSIGASTVVGVAGMMWVWGGTDRREKVFLEQLGSVKIGEGCRLGSNISVVRGNANEETVIENGVCIAHGSMIGHGCQLGENAHLANNVSLGGGVRLGHSTFLGCGSAVAPGKKLGSGSILGAGSTLVSTSEETGVYVGTPAKFKHAPKRNMSGVPNWK